MRAHSGVEPLVGTGETTNSNGQNAANVLAGWHWNYPVLVKAEWGRLETSIGSQDRRLSFGLQAPIGNKPNLRRYVTVPFRPHQESDMDPRLEHFLKRCAEDAASSARDWYDIDYETVESECESPIERLFLAAMVRWKAINPLEIFEIVPFNEGISLDGIRRHAWQHADPRNPHFPVTVAFLQCPIGRFRVDFLLGALRDEGERGRREHWIAVECDGHDFHDRTKQQAQRDKSRDRELMAIGVKVMRFTGAEIWRDPNACLIEALLVLDPDAQWFWVQGIKQ